MTSLWRFLDTGKGNAFFNMALDEAVVTAVSKGTSPPTVRFFEWEPSAITIGYCQKIHDKCFLERCTADGVDVTRRLTGGRAVFHAREVGYSVVGWVDDPVFGGGILETFKSINRVIADGFRALDVDLEMKRVVHTKRFSVSRNNSLPCFLTTSRFELSLGTRKIVGSAQRRFGRVFLQQGSILIGPGQERILNYLPCQGDSSDVYTYKQKLWCNSDVWKPFSSLTAADIKSCLRNAFRKTAACDSDWSKPTPEELECAEHLLKQRYSSKGWIAGDE